MSFKFTLLIFICSCVNFIPVKPEEKDELVKTASSEISILIDQIEKVIKGKRTFLEMVMTGFLTNGHILLEDVPGTGKTTVAKTLSKLISSTDFKRIQFTPDLLPYDITGVDVWDPESKAFMFKPGPLFTNIVLADEINRSTPKVQSALLEVMAERQVTMGNTTYPIKEPFLVIGTQNPIEMEGTYPLPAAQLDRFNLKLTMGYPDRESEYAVVTGDPSEKVLPTLKPIMTKARFLKIQKLCEEIHCDERLVHCAVDIAVKTRDHKHIRLRVSPRGSLMLIHACRALALIKGRSFITNQDIRELSPAVFGHRIITRGTGKDNASIIGEVTAGELAKIKHN